MKGLKIIFWIIASFVYIPLVLATVYYVDPAGDDGYDGEAPEYTSGVNGPKATIGAMAAIANDDDIIEVRFAVYSEQVDPGQDGTAGHPITIRGYTEGAEGTIPSWSESTINPIIPVEGRVAGFALNNDDYYDISKFTVTGIGTGKFGVDLIANCDGVNVSYCDFYGTDLLGQGFFASGGSNPNVSWCTATGLLYGYRFTEVATGGNIDCSIATNCYVCLNINAAGNTARRLWLKDSAMGVGGLKGTITSSIISNMSDDSFLTPVGTTAKVYNVTSINPGDRHFDDIYRGAEIKNCILVGGTLTFDGAGSQTDLSEYITNNSVYAWTTLTQTIEDIGSLIYDDPNFTDLAGGDYTRVSSFPEWTAGTTVGTLVDFSGQTFSDPPTIGAYSGPLPTASPTPIPVITATPSPTPQPAQTPPPTPAPTRTPVPGPTQPPTPVPTLTPVDITVIIYKATTDCGMTSMTDFNGVNIEWTDNDYYTAYTDNIGSALSYSSGPECGSGVDVRKHWKWVYAAGGVSYDAGVSGAVWASYTVAHHFIIPLTPTPAPTATPADARLREHATGDWVAYLHNSEGSNWYVGLCPAPAYVYVHDASAVTTAGNSVWYCAQWTSGTYNLFSSWVKRSTKRNLMTFEYPTPTPTPSAQPTPSVTPTATPTTTPTPRIHYVDITATGSHDGSSWGNAYTSIMSPFPINDGTQLWVAAGQYGSIDDEGIGLIDPSGSGTIYIYGGFDGSEISLSERNWVENKSYISYLYIFSNGEINIDGLYFYSENGTSISNEGAVSFNLYNCYIGGNGQTPGVTEGPLFNLRRKSGINHKLYNTLIVGNHLEYGAEIFKENDEGLPGARGSIEIDSCTIAFNSVTSNIFNSETMAVFSSTDNITINNTIVWNPVIPTFTRETSDLIVTYSDIQGGWATGTCISLDPQFVNQTTGNFYLKSNSPCIGVGWTTLSTDWTGAERGSSETDIGAVEYVTPTPVP